MSQLLDLAGTIGTIVATFLIMLGVIWQIQSGSDDEIGNALPAPRTRPNQAAGEDDLRLRIEDIEGVLAAHRNHIVRIERKLRGAGVIIWALICAPVSLYLLAKNDWVPGLCFLAMGISFGIYGLVNVFSSERSHWWRRSGGRMRT
jgi:hypothetical protein